MKKNGAHITLDFKEPTPGAGGLVPRLEDLWGTFRIVSSVPTWTPHGRFEDSVVLYVSGTTVKLYVYDPGSVAWQAVGAVVDHYVGRVDSGGSSVSLPSGWSCSSSGTGDYTITHTLGTANYTVNVTPYGVTAVPSVISLTSTTFRITFYSLGASLVSTEFMFAVFLDNN